MGKNECMDAQSGRMITLLWSGWKTEKAFKEAKYAHVGEQCPSESFQEPDNVPENQLTRRKMVRLFRVAE